MDFNNVRILGYSHSSNFFGEDVFRFRSDKNLSIQGTLLDLTGANKVSSGIWNEMNLLSNFSDYEPVVINGVTFGSGRMESLTFEPGQDIDSKDYSATLSVYVTGNLFNLTGEFYTGIDISNYRYINDLAEDFSYDTVGDEKTYTQRIAISCFSGNGINPLDLAKNIAENLFSVNSITGLISDYNYVNSNPKYTESIDLINNSYQVDKTVTIGNESGDYSVTRTHSVSLGEDGYVTVEEKGEIKGIKNSDPWTAAITGTNKEVETSYPRCSGVFNVYNDSPSAELNQKILSLSKNLNRFSDSISYSVLYSNDKRNKFIDGASHEQTSEVSQNENGLYEVNLRGTVLGWGLNHLQKFEAAKTAFNNDVKPFFNNIVRLALQKNATTFLPWKVLSSSVSYSQFNGSVSYDYTYTTDYSYKAGIFKKEEVDISDTYKNNIINRYGIFNQSEIIQKSSIYSMSSRNLSLTLIGKRGVLYETYLTRARDIINGYIPGESLLALDVYIKEIDYTFNPNRNTLNVNLVWEFTSRFLIEKSAGYGEVII